MRALRSSALAAVALGTLGFANLATAGIAWTAPNGSTATYSWANGQNQNGLYGTPIALDSGLYFTPGMFASVQTNGGMTTLSDMLTVDLTLTQPDSGPRKQFSGFKITQRGDLALQGNATATIVGGLSIKVLESIAAPVVGDPGYVQVLAGTVFGVNDVSGYRHYIGSTLDPQDIKPFPAVVAGGAFATRLWDGSLEVTLPAGITKVELTLTNSMTTFANDNASTALMEMKSVEDPFNIEVFAGDIPEPASMMVLGAAGVLLLKRRSK
jgi:hypothetical protein